MSMDKTYAVFGLGRYGSAVARELAAHGADVLGVDMNETRADDAAEYLPLCKCADVTDPDVIKRLGIANVDTVIVAMASHMEASIMATMLCKEAGVSTVIVKCQSDVHGKILTRVGADRVVFPESESGMRLAKNLLSSGFIDMAELSDRVSVVEIPCRSEWVGKTLAQLRLRDKYRINVIAVCRGERVDIAIDPTAPIAADMRLIVVADTDKLKKLR